MPSNTIPCAVCGKIFNRRGSAKHRCKAICCSRACAGKMRVGVRILGFNIKKKHSVVCKTCGRVVFAPPSQHRLYCTTRCMLLDPDFRDKIKGPNHYNWKGGVNPKNQIFRKSKAYYDWRTKVFKRERFTCNICHHYGKGLQAHHRIPWADHPELRFEVDNGITLCKKCHFEVHEMLKRLKLQYQELRDRYVRE